MPRIWPQTFIRSHSRSTLLVLALLAQSVPLHRTTLKNITLWVTYGRHTKSQAGLKIVAVVKQPLTLSPRRQYHLTQI